MTRPNLNPTLEMAERIGRAILDSEHAHFMDNLTDNSEYIPVLHRIIKSMTQALLQEGCSKEECFCFSVRLHDHAKKLFVDFWMHLAREDKDEQVDLELELIEANKTFDDIYTGKLNSLAYGHKIAKSIEKR